MMNLGEFRQLTDELPDSTELFADQGDLQMWDLRVGMVLPPVLEHPHAITLELGQVWNFERDMDARIDARQL